MEQKELNVRPYDEAFEEARKNAIKEYEDTRALKKAILDSGERREFDSGAVRDIAEGKGRCDLLPLNVISMYFNMRINSENTNKDKAIVVTNILHSLDFVLQRKDDDFLEPVLQAANSFVRLVYGEQDGLAILELAKHYEEGAKKYAERNWEKGIPAHCYIDSCVRHLLKWYDGWEDEPHDRAVLWNLFGLAWTLINKPDFDDRPKGDKKA